MMSFLVRYMKWLSKFLKNKPIADGISTNRATTEKERKRLLVWTERALRWAYMFGGAQRCINFIGRSCLVPLLSFFYVDVIFPLIPQLLRGGRPISVRLILSGGASPNARDFRNLVG